MWLDTKSCWCSLKNEGIINDLIFEKGILSSKIKHLPIMTRHSPILYRKWMKWYPGRAVSFLDTDFHWLPVQNGRITSDCWSKLVCRKLSPFQKLYHNYSLKQLIFVRMVDFKRHSMYSCWSQTYFLIFSTNIKRFLLL